MLYVTVTKTRGQSKETYEEFWKKKKKSSLQL